MNTVFNQLSLEAKNNMAHELSDIQFYKGHTKQIRKFCESIGAIEFPSIYLLAKDHKAVYDYVGDVSVKPLINFIHKMTRIDIKEVDSLSMLKKHVKRGSNILLVGDKKWYKAEFNIIAMRGRKYFRNAFWSNSEEFHKKFNIEKDSFDAIAYFTINGTLNEGERMHITRERMLIDKLFNITEIYSRNAYSFANHHKLDTIIHNGLKAVIAVHNNTEETEVINKAMNELALKYREEYYFLKVNATQPIGGLVTEIFHLEGKGDLPRVVIVDNILSNGIDLDMYVSPQAVALNKNTIESFISNHKNGLLQRLLISEPLRSADAFLTEQEKLVIKEQQANQSLSKNSTRKNKTSSKPKKEFIVVPDVIGFNFDKLVFNTPGKDTVVFICTDSKFCKNAELRFKRAYKKLHTNTTNPNLAMYNLNYLYNEAPGLNISHIPSLIIVPDITSNTAKKVIHFSANFRTNNIVNFITQNSINKPSITTLDKEEKLYKAEAKKRVKVRTRSEDENTIEIDQGFPLGNGFMRSVQRWNFNYEEENRDDDEGYGYEHDIEDYDLDEEDVTEEGNHDEL